MKKSDALREILNGKTLKESIDLLTILNICMSFAEAKRLYYQLNIKNDRAIDYLRLRGINSFEEFSEITGITKRRLQDWWHNEGKAFKLLVDGYLYQNREKY